jgi:hypothetical protein
LRKSVFDIPHSLFRVMNARVSVKDSDAQ